MNNEDTNIDRQGNRYNKFKTPWYLEIGINKEIINGFLFQISFLLIQLSSILNITLIYPKGFKISCISGG